MARSFVTNPLTGRPIQIGGAVFNRLIFEAYDLINGELVRRDSAPALPTREYYYNVVTRRRILSGSRRYHELISANWNIESDYYLIPPWINLANRDITPQFLLASDLIPAEQPHRDITYEQIMDRHRNTLNTLNITLCKECFHPIKIEDGDYCNECRPE